MRILFVFAWIATREATEVGLLAQALDPARHVIDVVACVHSEETSDRTHRTLEASGVRVDTTPYHLSFDETISYLTGILPGYDAVVSCQNVADVYPALERLHLRPPLIERGGLVSDALAGPKHFTTRYVGVSAAIRDAAAGRMPGREDDAIEIPPMVDIRALDASRVDKTTTLIGSPDAVSADHAERLCEQAGAQGLADVVMVADDGPDVPALLSALDMVVRLSRGEDTPDVVVEAGAAALPVIAVVQDRVGWESEDGVSMLFVPPDDPDAVAEAINRLIGDAPLRRRLGDALHASVRARYSVEAVAPQWERLFDAVRRPTGAPAPSLFRSVFQGGFECSTHRRAHDRARIDVIAATRHDALAKEDYRILGAHGILTVRDGVRWHRVEQTPGSYDWSSLETQLAGAAATGTQVIWDLLHYGWPDDVDVWGADFVTRFASFAAAAARVIRAQTTGTCFYCPINEISFLSWGGGDVAYLNPFARGRGFELKVQLAHAAIAAMRAILADDSAARFTHVDPVINVVADPARSWETPHAEGHRQAQFQGWDLIAGRIWPQIGGHPDLLDIVGVNYYHNNQWIHGGPAIDRHHALHKPFHRILAETHARYGRPIFVAETGIEGDARAGWLEHVGDEVRQARRLGVPVEGICLYPVLDHPGWDDERPCPNGLLHTLPDTWPNIGARRADPAYAAELARQQDLLCQ